MKKTICFKLFTTFLILNIFAFSVYFPSSATSNDLLRNGSFDNASDLTLWNGSNMQYVTHGADNSVGCVRITSQNVSFANVSQTISPVKGQWYYISAKVKLAPKSGGGANTTNAKFYMAGLTGFSDESFGYTTVNSDGWTKVATYFKYIGDNNNVSCTFQVRIGQNDAASVLDGAYVDEVSIVEVNPDEDSLLIDGGFEKSSIYRTSDSNTVYRCSPWIKTNCDITFDTTEKYSGQSSLKLSPKTGGAHPGVSQFVHFDNDAWYEVSAYVKLSQIPANLNGRTIAARFVNNHYTTYVNSNGETVTGSCGNEHMGLKMFNIEDTQWHKISYIYSPKEWQIRQGTNAESSDGYIGVMVYALQDGSKISEDIKLEYYLDDVSVKKLQPNNIEIAGSQEVVIPAQGTKSETYSAKAELLLENETGNMPNETISLSALNNDTSVQFQNNQLVLTSASTPQTIQICADLVSDNSVSKTIDVEIITNKTYLARLISKANEIYNTMDEKEPGSKKRLLSCIEAVTAVSNNQNSTELQASDSAISLKDAVSNFENSVNKSELNQLISVAEELYIKTQIGTQPGMCTDLSKQTFRTEINNMKSVRDIADINATQLNDSVKALNNSINTFKRGIVPYRAFYVDGNVVSTGDGTLNNPFKTIEEARNAVRLISGNMNGDIIVYIASDNYYYNTSALEFGVNDSGRNGFSVIYKGYGETKPILHGGMEVDPAAWQIHDQTNNIYKAYIGTNIATRQFFVNGLRATRAKSNTGLNNPVFNASYGYTSTDTFLASYSRVQDLEFVYNVAWTNPRCGVNNITIEGSNAKIVMDQTGWQNITTGSCVVTGAPWYYENAYELLDQEGEWYYNSSDGFMYYKPKQGEIMSEAYCVVPTIDGEMVKIAGNNPDNVIHDVIFDGIQFSYTTWTYPSSVNGHDDYQNNHIPRVTNDMLAPSAVWVQYGHQINFYNCEFSHLGITALKYTDSIQNCRIEGNNFYDISGSAVNLGSPNWTNVIDAKYENNTYYYPAHSKYYIMNNDILNNYIHDIGVEYRSAAAISAGYPINTEIAHNVITDVPYDGIHVGYGWSFIPNSIIKNVKIHHNYFENIFNSVMADGGAIYIIGPTSGTDDEPNLIFNNYIKSFITFSKNSYGSAIYFDQGASNWKTTGNVIDLSTSLPSYFSYKVWLSPLQDSSKQNILVDDNYISVFSRTSDNDDNNNHIQNTWLIEDLNWPDFAQDVIDNAGLED